MGAGGTLKIDVNAADEVAEGVCADAILLIQPAV
jgi:hypothetical protein